MGQKETAIAQLTEEIAAHWPKINAIETAIKEVIIGQPIMLNRLLIGLLSDGHILLEGVPGLAKTLTIKSLAKAIDTPFSRIQFTPDLLPADIVGTMIFHQQQNEFVVRKGPIFSNFVLADEINRAPAKVQSALLEAMQEKQVTIGDRSYPLSNPFLVLATQNPLEQEGTYPLPEAQADRFMLKVVVGYPDRNEEQLIIRQQVQSLEMPSIKPVATTKDILDARWLVKRIYMDEKIEQYILDIIFSTRYPQQYGLHRYQNMITNGGSPRASIHLAMAAKALAFTNKRAYVLPDDVKAIAKEVLRHRIGLSYEAEAESVTSDMIIQEILQIVKVP